MRNLLRFWDRSNQSQSAVSYESSSQGRRKNSHVHLGREFEGTVEERCHLTEEPAGRVDPHQQRSLGQNKPHGLNKASSVLDGFFNPRKRGHSTRRPRCVFMMMVAGLIGIGSSIFILLVHPYDLIFKMKCMLTDGSESFEMWSDPPVELRVKIYIFNVTNSEAFLRGEEKMQIEEIGPYIYLESPLHDNITFNANGTMSTIPRHPLRPTDEGRSEDDILVVPNIALLSITQSNVDSSYFTRLGLNLLVRQTASEPLVRMTAREFMFGYKTPLVTLGNNLLPGWIKFDKLGLIDRMYDFEGDYETVYTGETEGHLSGLLATYRGSRYLPQWPGGGGECGDVRGASDGTKYASFIERGQKQKFYRKSLCRPADLVHVNDSTINGLDSYVYTFADDAFDNGWRNEEHKCYCRYGRCLNDGLIDVTDCYYGFPIALSYPHFYKGDPTLSEHVNGYEPEPELHQTEVHIEPNTGMPLQVAFRLQINMVFTDLSSMIKVERFSNMVLPLLWFEIGMPGLPTGVNNKFIFYLNIMPVVEQIILYGGFIIGSLVLITSIIKVLMTVPYKGRSISENFKQYNVPNPKSWLRDENGKSDGKHIQGFKHQSQKGLDPISEKYLGTTSGSIYNPCEENFKKNKEDQSLININKLEDTKKSDTWLNKSLGDFLSKSIDKAKPYFSAENLNQCSKTPVDDSQSGEKRNYEKSSRKFSENRAFLCNEVAGSHGVMKYGEVNENLSDIETDGQIDDLCESNSDDPYDYHKVPSGANSDNENSEPFNSKTNHGMV